MYYFGLSIPYFSDGRSGSSTGNHMDTAYFNIFIAELHWPICNYSFCRFRDCRMYLGCILFSMRSRIFYIPDEDRRHAEFINWNHPYPRIKSFKLDSHFGL